MRNIFITMMTLLMGIYSTQSYAEKFNHETESKSGPQTATDKIVNRFMELDLDETDDVSFDEYMIMIQERAQARFESMDSNHDGVVHSDEYRHFWKTQKSQYYRLKR